MNEVTRALSFATKFHKKQFRKGTRIPFMCHILNVCKLLAERDCPEDLIIAALLHDLPEDTKVTVDDIEYYFGKRVASLVEGACEPYKLENKEVEVEDTWKERKQQTIAFIEKGANYGQLLIILADKLDNIKSIRYDLSRLGEELWGRFNAGKQEQKWYYTSLLAALTKRSKQSSYIFTELLDEFTGEVNQVFGTKNE
jgi:(p)ppGpp synthase/HD superfamily hydrolase